MTTVKKKTLTKRHMIDSVAKTVGMPYQKAREVVQLFLDSITHALSEGHRLEFRNFGVFDTVIREPKQGRNLQTNQPLVIPSRKIVTFTPGKSLRKQEIRREEKRGKRGATSRAL